ncbi:MAG: hypothetical protein WCD43_17795 [Candidatus Acidiferrales bacterium]
MNKERKEQLRRIVKARGNRNVLVYASDSAKFPQSPVALNNSDLIPINDQISNLPGKAIDVLLETGGGSGETAEDIVHLLHLKYESVAFIIPGMAKSAGTIMAMAGDEILMEPGSSSLGPIDAQIQWEGKSFSAEAFLKGLQNIKDEVAATNTLNRAYIPMLQRISPGEIQHAENALSFAKVLVKTWLKEYKFKNWTVHRTHNPGSPVTDEEKIERASGIADKLCDHSQLLSHGRSIKLEGLHAIGLEITDYSKIPELADAIQRYRVLLQMTFDTTAIYKIFESVDSQIYKWGVNQQIQVAIPAGLPGGFPAIRPGLPPQLAGFQPTSAIIQFACNSCKKTHSLQADFDQQQPLQPGAERFPSNDILICNQCQTSNNLLALRRQIELQSRRKVAR